MFEVDGFGVDCLVYDFLIFLYDKMGNFVKKVELFEFLFVCDLFDCCLWDVIVGDYFCGG